MTNLIDKITQYGDFYQLDNHFNVNKLLKDLEPFEDKWAKYNPRKPQVPRDGLCVINDKGKCGPGPALDSLLQWNTENGTRLKESDFNIPTELYHSSNELQRVMEPMLDWSVRSHFLRLPPGGYFSPHRDHVYYDQKSFRIIWPLQNCNPPSFRFMLEDTTLNFDHGHCYVINTTKAHTLFNASPSNDSMMLVVNALICEDSITFIQDKLYIR